MKMDGMHVLIGSVPGMRPPLTGCPYFYPWLHVTVLNSTGKCTQPPCVLTPLQRHSLPPFESMRPVIPLPPFLFLPFSSLQETRKEGLRTRDPEEGWKANENQRMPCTPSSLHNMCTLSRRFLRKGRRDLKLASKTAPRTRHSGTPGHGQDSRPGVKEA